MGDIYYDEKGYPRWRDTGRLVHRTVAAKKVGGRIFRDMVVHHRDGNKKNFKKSNLVIMSKSRHSRLHLGKRKGGLLGELISPFSDLF